MVIESQGNETFKRLKKLLSAHGLKKDTAFLVSGEKVLREILAQKPDVIEAWITTPALIHSLQTLTGITPHEVRVRDRRSETTAIHELSQQLFRELDIAGTDFPIALCRQPEISDWDPKAPAQGLEVLIATGNPANLGAILRSSLAFAASKVILLKESAHPLHPKSVRAAAGSLFHLRLERGPAIHELECEDLIALDMDGNSLAHFAWPKAARLLVGEEGQGVPSSVKAQRVAIPMQAGVESLNALAALSIALYDYRVKQPL